MIKLKMRLAMALILALCVMPLSAPLALAETSTSIESVEETNPSGETAEVGEPSTDSEVALDTEETGDLQEPEEEAANNPEDTTENDTGEIPDSSVNEEEELPPVLDENGEVVQPGTLPDSPFYWLTTLIEKLQVILTVDPVEKTELLEDQALERIAEAGALIENGDTEEAEVALNAYSKKVAEAQAFLALLTETDSETTQKLETALSKTHANNVQTLGALLDKLPSQAAQRVALNIVRSMEKSIAKMEKKDQKMVAKELRKATKGIEDDGELTEEDQTALENLDDLQEGELEEEEAVEADAVADAPGVPLVTMALTTNTLTASPAVSTEKKSLVQNSKGNVTEPQSEAKVLDSTKQQEPKGDGKNEPKGEPEDKSKDKVKDGAKDEAKVEVKDEVKALEKRQQEEQAAKLKAEQEIAIKEKDQSSSNSAQKQEREKSQEKAPKESGKGAKSGGKER